MEDSGKLAELAESVLLLREDVKLADDTLQGVKGVVHTLLMASDAHTMDRIRSRMIDIDGKVTAHGERFDRIDEALKQILDHQKGASA